MCLTRSVVTAIAATFIAIGASGSALAQEPVEVVDEATAEHCAPTCGFHMSGTATTFTNHFMGVELPLMACNDDFDALIGESGEGELYEQRYAGGGCTVWPCEASSQAAGDGDHWPLELHEDAGQLYAIATLCITFNGGPGGGGCPVKFNLEASVTHVHHVVADPGVCGVPPVTLEIDGEWDIDGVEFVH